MGRRAKSLEPPPAIRTHFAENVRRLRDRVYVAAGSDTERNKALAKAARTSLSQVQRIVGAKSDPGIDALEKFAAALGCRPQDLVTPYFAYRGVTDDPDGQEARPVRDAMFSDRGSGRLPAAARL